MLRKFLAAAVLVVLGVGVAFAGHIRGFISKVEGDKITFAPREGKGKDAKWGEERTLPVAKDVKVVKGIRNVETKKVEPGETIEGGLSNKMFTDIDTKKGLTAVIITDKDNKNITEIRVMQRKKK